MTVSRASQSIASVETEPTRGEQGSAADLGAARLLVLAQTTARLLVEARDARADVGLGVRGLDGPLHDDRGRCPDLIGQLARQDDVTDADAARSLLSPDASR